MLRRTITTVAAVALALGLLLSSVAAATVTRKPLSDTQWRKAADSICTKANTSLDAAASTAFAGVPADQQPSIEQMAAYVGLLQPIVQDQIDDLDALKEPSKLKVRVKQLLKKAQGELEALVADPNRGFDGNPFSDTIVLAGKLKLKACAS